MAGKTGTAILRLGAWVLPAWLAAASVHAVELAAPQVSREQPVMLKADQLDYDKDRQLVIAQGKVEVVQGDTVLLADLLTYDQRSNIVFAQGHVSVLEPSGNVYFADEAELTDDMKKGVVANIRARFSDNSLFAANEGIRVNENVTELYKAVYSPCAVTCKDGTPKTPLWQIRADRAVIDRAEQDITYKNAYMDAFGFPVAYTPYLSHATPDADNRSGLLTPQYRHDANLGHVVQVPLYWAIAPDKDLTATLMHTSLEAPVVIGEYRQRLDNGHFRFTGSATNPDDRDPLGNPRTGNDMRGHLFGDGAFQVSDRWQWGFDIRRTTDDTYLRRYDFNRDPLLTSRVYGQGVGVLGTERSYAVAQGLAFQGMQRQDDARRSPLVFPVMDLFYQTQPMAWNSRFALSGGLMSLTRDLGADSRRLSVTGEWTLPYITGGGHVFEAAGRLRADGYDIDNHRLTGGRVIDGREGRIVPEASLDWRYPLVSRFESATVIIEPAASVIASPGGGNTQRIPNEDSAIPEFTDTNLFSHNRFAGHDRLETGPRANYGLHSQLQFAHDKYVSALIGQAYRADNDPLFPISNNPRSHFSDYVGKLGLTYAPVDLNYRFRLDRRNLILNRSELESSLSFWRVSIGANYLNLRNDPIVRPKEEISGGLSMRLTDTWTWNLGAHRDLQRDDLVSASTGLVFHNECLTVHTTLGREYTSDRDFQESTSVTFQVFFKNLN